MCSMKTEPKGLTRRNFLAGTAAAAVASSVGFANMAHAAVKAGGETVTPIETMNKYGSDLLNMLVLRTYPIAIKMLKDESEIPQGAVRPKRDLGEHYSACQVFGIVRRRGTTLAMFIEDHWCFEPIIGYGLVEPPEDFLEGSGSDFFIQNKEAAKERNNSIPILPYGKYAGMVLAPLHKANFAPDLTVIYCNATQLRHMLFAMLLKNGYRVTSTLDPLWSCVHSVVPSLLTGECEVTVPDPGEFERGGVGDDEMMLSIPTGRMEELMTGVYHYDRMGMGYRSFGRELKGDFQQPPFYKQYFKKWGLDTQ
ncbi:hypothetical protein AMJ80_11800 [bacterium SM23_31]|nr:MAG: hypothetical protein AMJ80_11800 [bacterium SM23_31]